MPTADLQDLRNAFAELSELHGWESFQTPRNMALALTGRVGAVAAHLQFAPDDAETPSSPELRAEIADCLVYLMNLAGALDIDVVDEAVTRIRAAVASGRAAAATTDHHHAANTGGN